MAEPTTARHVNQGNSYDLSRQQWRKGKHCLQGAAPVGRHRSTSAAGALLALLAGTVSMGLHAGAAALIRYSHCQGSGSVRGVLLENTPLAET